MILVSSLPLTTTSSFRKTPPKTYVLLFPFLQVLPFASPSPSPITTMDGWILLTSSFFDFYVGSDCVYSKTCRLRLEK